MPLLTTSPSLPGPIIISVTDIPECIPVIVNFPVYNDHMIVAQAYMVHFFPQISKNGLSTQNRLFLLPICLKNWYNLRS